MKAILGGIALIASACILATNAQAGQFTVRTYGGSVGPGSGDIRDIVIDDFTRRFPHDRWVIVLHTNSGTTDNGRRWCYALAGVVPKNSGHFPVHRYASTVIEDSPSGSMNVGEQREWAVRCGRNAVDNMMSDDLNKVYIPNKP